MLLLLLVIILLQLLKVFNAAELHILKSLKVDCSLTACFSSTWESFFIHNRNMTAESAEKHCSIVLNVKLQVQLTSKRFIDFKTFY